MSARHGLNKVAVVIANAAAYSTGWAFDARGQPEVQGSGYVQSTVYAAIQPFQGARRRVDGGGAQEQSRIKIFFYKDATGVFPTILGGIDLPPNYLPTLIQWGGDWHEVQLVDDWQSGLLPHIMAEAEKLSITRDPVVSVGPDGDGDTVVW